MNKINKNNLENLRALYGSYKIQQSGKEEKQEETKTVKEFEPKKVDANALDLLAAQNRSIQLNRVDVSESATQRRIEQAFANSAFMKSLDEMQGFEEDFTTFAMAHISGVNKEKLAKYLNKPLSPETVAGTENLARTLLA